MKTTQPRRYLVRPNQGLIAPHGTESISILLVDKDKQVLLTSFDRLGQSALDHSKDKFLVQSCAVSYEFAKKYAEEKSKANTAALQKELADGLTGMWNMIASNGSTPIFNKKIHVKHIATPDNNNLAPTTTNRSTSNPTTSLAAIETMTPEQMFSELTSLRRKYDELVSFSVNLTAERDILNNTLEQTKRDLNREIAARTTLENKGGGGANKSTGAGKKSSTVVMQLLVIGLIAFLVGVKLTHEGKAGFLHSVPVVGGFVLGSHGANATSKPRPALEDQKDL